MKTITHDLRDTLEGKEIEIYRLLCLNRTNSQIAHEMNMPYATVRWNLRNIYRKLGVDTTTGDTDTQLPRRRAMLYSGTKIEQVVSYGKENGEGKSYGLKEIRNAAKKTGFSSEQIENLISFLEML
jgi:FPC/CPF motif-containing protein YcgG